MPTERAVPNTFGAVSRRILKSLVDLPLPFRIFYGLLIFVPLELGAVPESFLPDSKHRFICYRARVVNLLVAGGARMASSLQETGVTHVIAQPDTICSPRYWAAQISVM